MVIACDSDSEVILIIYLFIYSFIHLLIYLFIHSFIHVFIYLLIIFQNPYTGVRPMDIGTVKE